ncbi:LOW QUALITY PROTEIN: uncharacterized protein LOC132925316 [Rhopalosiphum padi]|uniref:LOW QUALITY PROTEIN: uncharacterized protein LOC132925316 n=1 Tax=Rhopalosiphum padi TaxID=40932 RepID=UPI00298DE77B|nr:LOW QUALITY PROTEIN: uncharacterized protein LOC132925316 [Rhopalosiphum padi]
MRIHPSKSSIKWDHYSQVFKCDTKTMLKICPKITRHHIELNNMTKMKVKFVTQVLKQNLLWLDEWEKNLEDGLIQEKEFLTKATSESLRLTLKSTIDLKFFGIIRQTSGPNDHPTTPTFLQLYRLLSICSLVKPPRSGNCTVIDASSITLTELNNDESYAREEKIEKLKNYIDKVVEEGKWDMDDVFRETNFNDDTTFNCVVYYLAGYLARKLSKKTKCQLCSSGIKNNDSIDNNLAAAKLTNLKSRGYLTQADSGFYILLRQIENSFALNAQSPNAFDDTIDHFFNNNYIIPFPCDEHKHEIVQFIFESYLTMIMRQFTWISNKQTKSTNKVKKKLSKLVPH